MSAAAVHRREMAHKIWRWNVGRMEPADVEDDKEG